MRPQKHNTLQFSCICLQGLLFSLEFVELSCAIKHVTTIGVAVTNLLLSSGSKIVFQNSTCTIWSMKRLSLNNGLRPFDNCQVRMVIHIFSPTDLLNKVTETILLCVVALQKTTSVSLWNTFGVKEGCFFADKAVWGHWSPKVTKKTFLASSSLRCLFPSVFGGFRCSFGFGILAWWCSATS